MKITNFTNIQYSLAYDILCSSIPSRGERDALYPTFCRIIEGGSSKKHSHFEAELFFIVSGQGLMSINNEVSVVGSGDLIQIPPFSMHELKNTGASDVVFLSVYSEDYEVQKLPVQALITAAPPTPNGPLHLGHISGPYLASDILQRYLLQRSVKATSHSGTDDHQNYVGERARALNIDPEIFRQKMRSRIDAGFKKMKIEFNEFVEPKKNSDYQKKILNFTQRIIDAGLIEKETLALPYCDHCAQFLVDALIDGICPSCEHPSKGGCENCGLVVPPQDLHLAQCSHCQTLATRKTASVYVFALSQYLPLIADDLAALSLPPRLRKLVDRVYRNKNLKVLVSHPDPNRQGIQLPGSDQALHVWFEMAAHYESFALLDQTWIHCFGFDNSFHYLLFIPAILKALNPRSKLPNSVISNEFLLLDEQKFSTSRNHAIWADEFELNADHLRLFLALNRPAQTQSNYSVDDFQNFSNDLQRQLQLLAKGPNQSLAPSGTQPVQRIFAKCNRFTRDMDLYLSPQNFDLRAASRCLLAFIDASIQEIENPQLKRLMLQTLIPMMNPFMPEEAAKLLSAINKQTVLLQNSGIGAV